MEPDLFGETIVPRDLTRDTPRDVPSDLPRVAERKPEMEPEPETEPSPDPTRPPRSVRAEVRQVVRPESRPRAHAVDERTDAWDRVDALLRGDAGEGAPRSAPASAPRPEPSRPAPAPAARPAPGRSPRPSAPPELEGYRFRRRIGGGGSSDVYLYQQLTPERPVAIKVLRRGVDPALLDRELRMMGLAPATVTAALHHTGETAEGRRFAVLEYVADSLADRIARGDRDRTVRHALALAHGLGTAVAVLHEAGIVHLDIKPANVLIRADGSIVLTDFGSAAHVADSPTGRSHGYSPDWASPEAASERAILTERADIFSFTATLRALMPGDASEDDPRIPPRLRALLRRGLAYHPQERPASMRDVLDELSAIRQALLPDPELPTGTDVGAGAGPGADVDRLIDRTWARVQQFTAAEEWAEALPPLDQVVELLRESGGDPVRLINPLIAQGMVRARLGWADAAEHPLREARQLADDAADAETRRKTAFELGRVAALRNRHREAVPHFDTALDDLPSASGRTTVELERALSVRELGRYDEAADVIDRVRRTTPELFARATYELGVTYLRMRGRQARARSLFRAAANAYRRAGDRAGDLQCQFELARASVALGRLEEAVETYSGIRRAIDVRALPERTAECELRLGELLTRLGRLGDARTHLDAARARYQDLESARGEADADLRLAVLEGMEGRRDAAEHRFVKAFTVFRGLGLRADAATCEIERAQMWARAALRRTGAAAGRMRHRAADIAIPAALALDAGRYELNRSADRQSWSHNVVQDTRNAAFRLAFEAGDDRLVADLVLDARSVGTYAVAAPGEETGESPDAGTAPSAGGAVSGVPPIDPEDAPQHALAASATWRILGGDGIRLGLAPLVIAPRGDFALRAAIAAAKSRFGVGVRSGTSIEA